MPEDKKPKAEGQSRETPKDRVISMEEFKKGAVALDEPEVELPSDDELEDMLDTNNLLKYMLDLNLDSVVAVGVTKEGRLVYFSNDHDPAHIVFLCESFKKAILENTLERAEVPSE